MRVRFAVPLLLSLVAPRLSAQTAPDFWFTCANVFGTCGTLQVKYLASVPGSQGPQLAIFASGFTLLSAVNSINATYAQSARPAAANTGPAFGLYAFAQNPFPLWVAGSLAGCGPFCPVNNGLYYFGLKPTSGPITVRLAWTAQQPAGSPYWSGTQLDCTVSATASTCPWNALPSSATPEPGTWLLMATGLGAIGLVGWRRRQSA